jgi:hypothetical protein
MDVPACKGTGSGASSLIAIPPDASWRKPTLADSIAPRAVVRVPRTETTDPSGSKRASAIAVAGSGVGVGVAVGSGVGVGAGVGVGVGAGVGVGVGAGVGVGVGAGVGVGVGAGVGVGVGTMDGVGVGAGVALGTGVGVGVSDGATVGVGVGVGPGLALGPGAGVGAAARFCGVGTARIAKSLALSFESAPLPSDPPGRRSMLEPLAGAGAATPSTNALLASPHPTASIAMPPTGRSATAPPVAANPPLYVASAMPAWMPEELAISRCRPGARIVGTVQAALRVIVPPLDVT